WSAHVCSSDSLARLQLAIADLARPQVSDVIRRKRKPVEVFDPGWAADALRYQEVVAFLALLDILDGLHIAGNRRGDPARAEDGHLFRGVRLEQLCHRLPNEELLLFLRCQ